MRIHFADLLFYIPERVKIALHRISPFPQGVETPCSYIGHGYAIRTRNDIYKSRSDGRYKQPDVLTFG